MVWEMHHLYSFYCFGCNKEIGFSCSTYDFHFIMKEVNIRELKSFLNDINPKSFRITLIPNRATLSPIMCHEIIPSSILIYYTKV